MSRFVEPKASEKLTPYWLMLLDRGLPVDAHELEHEDPVSAYFSAEVLRRARLGLGETQRPKEQLQQVADAARAVLFAEAGSPEELSAHVNLAHVMCVHVDGAKSLEQLRGAVLSYQAPSLVWWKRWLAAAEFALTGRLRYPLLREVEGP